MSTVAQPTVKAKYATVYDEAATIAKVKIPAASSGAFRAGGHYADNACSASTCPFKEAICSVGGICPPNPLTRMPFLPTASSGASWHDFVNDVLYVVYEDRIERFTPQMALGTVVLGDVTVADTQAVWDRINGGPVGICTSRPMLEV